MIGPTAGEETLDAAIERARADERLSSMKVALRLMDREGYRGPPFALSIARTFTVETQLDAIKFALALLPSAPVIRIGDYGVIEPLLLDETSELLEPKPDAIIVLWRLQDVYPDLIDHSDAWSSQKREEALNALRYRITSLCKGYVKRGAAPIFLSTFSKPPAAPLSDLTERFGIAEIVSLLNAAIYEMAASNDLVFVFDFADWAGRFGAAAFDRKLDIFARQPISAGALWSFARAIARSLRPLLIPARKVLALDLDNVLWGGILGEDGVSGLRTGKDFPGNVYRQIQQTVLKLKSRGVLLVLSSKNDEGDVVDAFGRLQDMPLRLIDFAATRINWEPKSANLTSMADELNVGIDSFAFIDDQAFEREEVRHELPAVHIIDGGSDPLGILQALEDTEVFDSLRITQTDRTRAADYVTQRERTTAQGTGDIESFLNSLELIATIVNLGQAGIDRAAQMLAKTNQFNVTNRRHSAADLRTMIAQPGIVALTMSLRDRFGDQGVIGLAIGLHQVDSGEMIIDTFLMSCRALGRGAEQALWSRFLEAASHSGAAILRARYVASPRNAQVADLFERLGMQRSGAGERQHDFVMALPASFIVPAWICINE